jgi:alpha-beta hydrolase superfamily lysophospholipase
MGNEPAVSRRDTNIECQGRRLFVREVAAVEPTHEGSVLFVHGNTFPSTAVFDLPIEGRSVVEHLARSGLRCCIFDHRGYGRSDKPRSIREVSIEEKVRDLAGVHRYLLEHRRVRSFHMVGLSTGCQTIASFLARSPALVRSVVMIGPCYSLNRRVAGVLVKLRAARLLNRIRGRSEDPYVRFSRSSLRRRILAGEEKLIDESTFDAYVVASLEGWSGNDGFLPSPVLGFPPLHERHGWGDRLFDASVIEKPTLLVRGERDEFCCWSSAMMLREDLPPGMVTILSVPGIKHNPSLYPEPARVFDHIGRFISAHAEVIR